MRNVTEKTAFTTSKHIKSIMTMKQTQVQMDDNLKKMADGTKQGESDNPFQSDKQLDINLTIHHGAEDDATSTIADGTSGHPSFKSRLPLT